MLVQMNGINSNIRKNGKNQMCFKTVLSFNTNFILSTDKKEDNWKFIPSELRFDIAVSATESSLKLGFIGLPLFVTSEKGNRMETRIHYIPYRERYVQFLYIRVNILLEFIQLPT